MKSRYLISLVLALVLLLTMALPAWAQKPDPGTGTSEIVLQNIDGASSTTIYVDYIDQGGNLVTTSDHPLAPYIATNVKTENISMLGDGWLGSAVAYSSNPVAAASNVFWTGGLYGEGKTAGAYAGFQDGSLNVYLPYIFNMWNRISVISVQNTSTTDSAQIQVHYVSRDGTELSTSPYADTIPRSGQVTYHLGNGTPAGKVPTVDFEGSVYITSNKPIVAVSQTHWRDFSTIYGGLPSGDTFLYYPQVVRGISPNGQWFRWSVMVVQNISTADVTVRVKVIGEDGSEKLSFDDTIPGQTAHIFNFRYSGSEMPTSIFDNLDTLLGGTNFAGSATVERIAGSGEIIGICHQNYANPMRAFTYEALGPGMGTMKVAFPDTYKVKSGSSWTTWSAPMIQNFSTTSTANVDIYFFTHDQANGGTGNAVLHLSKAIAPASRCGINTRYDTPCVSLSELDPLGTNWEGSIFVISQNQNIGGVMTTIAATPKQAWAYRGTNTP